MLIEVDKRTYYTIFTFDPNPFISERFIELNSSKADKVVWLVCDDGEHNIGLVAGIKDGVLKSPFSAPFGGVHFRKENIYISEIDKFINLLKQYSTANGLDGIEITMPPDLYHMTFNSKVSNSMFRHNFKSTVPDITNWVNLNNFKGVYSQKNSREYFRQAERNNLKFVITNDSSEKRKVYDLICFNRKKFGRPIFMTFEDVNNVSNIWSVDFFKVESAEQQIVASSIFYRNHPEICYAVFWGDNDEGRPLRAMDFMVLNLFMYYKNLGFKYIDLGISSESGIPNEGLMRFKESHEAVSSLRFRFRLDLKE